MFDRGFSETPWRRNGGNLGRPLKLRTSRPEDESLIGNAHLGSRRLAQAPAQQCPQGQFWDGKQCRGSIGTNPQGGGFPGQGAQQPPPAGGGGADAAAPQTPSCGVPPGYGPNESGAALACRAEDGTFTVYDYPTGSLLQTGVTQVCLDQWGNVTMADDGNPRCGNAPTGGTDCDQIPTDRPVVVCPPSNGVVVNYVVDAATGALITTGISSSCALPPNARQADVSDPYCSGGLVYGEGNAQPELVACELQGGSYEIRNASDFSLVAQGVTWAQLQTEYKNRRVLVTRNCSAIPGGGGGGAPAAGAPPPTGGAPAPTQPPGQPPLTTTPIQTGPGTEAGAGGQPTGGTGVLPGQTIPISPGSMTSPRFLQPVPVQPGGTAAAPGGVSAPGMTPLPYDMLRAIGGWNSEPQALVRALYRKYGRPDLVSAEHIVWKNRGQWYLTVVQNDQVVHNWPEPHYDFLYQVIRYPIDPKYYGDIVKFDGSVILDRTLGFVGSMCGDEGLNFLAVNLAHDIAAGDISSGEAQDAFVEAYRQYKEGGSPAYTQAIQFPVSPDYVGNPGEPA